MRVLMLYDNNYDILVNRDSRVQREAESLAIAGHEVSIFLIFHSKDVRKVAVKFGAQTITILGKGEQKPKCPKGINTIRKIAWFLVTSLTFRRILRAIQRFLNHLGFGKIIIYQGFDPLKTLLTLPADIYHAHDHSTLWFARFCGWFHKKPVIYDAHEFITRPGKSFFRNFVRIFIRYQFSKVNAIITVNDSVAQGMSDMYKIPKPVVVSNFPKYTELIPNKKLRETIGIADDVKVVLYLGTMDEGRGLDKLISASKYFPDVKFILMGFGSLKSTIKEQVANEGLKNVKVLDAVPPNEITSWASSANVGILLVKNLNPSRYFALPCKVGEYIMAGIPIAVCDYPELHKLAIDKDFGVVLNPEDINDIVRALRELLEPGTYAKKKKNVMKARKRYCWENEVKKLYSVYNKLLKIS